MQAADHDNSNESINQNNQRQGEDIIDPTNNEILITDHNEEVNKNDKFDGYHQSPDNLNDKGNHKLLNQNEMADLKFNTPFNQKVGENGQVTLESGRNLAYTNTEACTISELSPETKLKSKKKQRSSSKPKNFIKFNKNVKTRTELFKSYSEKKNERSLSRSNSNMMNSLSSKPSQILQQIKLQKKIPHNRLQDWKNLNLNNSLMAVEKPSKGAEKNISKDYVVKCLEVSLKQLLGREVSTNNLGGNFSQNKKEKMYQKRNESGINNMRSFATLDGPEKKIANTLPYTRGGKELKWAMNKSQIFTRQNSFLKYEDLPEEFTEAQRDVKQRPLRNSNNHMVSSSRERNKSSNIF